MKMKLILVTCLLLTSFAHSQTVEATYECEIKLDYEKIILSIPPKFRAQLSEPLKNEINAGVYINYLFKGNKNYSVFELEQKVNNSQSQGGIIFQQIMNYDNKPYYKDFASTPNWYYKEIDLGIKKILIKDSIPDYKWIISEDKKVIKGYNVIKAEGILLDSIKVTAWYTPSINLKDGPSTLTGLPGLILEAEIETNENLLIYMLKDIKISDKNLKFSIPSKGEVMSQNQYLDFVKDLQHKMKELHTGGVDLD